MSSATPARCRRSAIALACFLSAVLTFGLSPVASADPPDGPDLPLPTASADDYIVTLADAPIAAYDGDVAGYDATQPADGEDVDVDSADAKRYRAYLRKRQDTVAARIGSAPDDRYEVGVNAFTAEMTGQQAATLARTDGVVSVHRNTLRRVPDDKKSVDFLGLSGSDGVWSKLGGADDAGRGVVVGVIDSGIWPESDSFAGDPLPMSRPKKGAGERHAADPLRGHHHDDEVRWRHLHGPLPGRRGLHRQRLQQQDRRRPLLRRGMAEEGARRRAQRQRVRLAPRRRGPRQSHRVDRGRQPRCPGRRGRPRLRPDLRRRPGGQDRGLQGAVAGQGRHPVRRLRLRHPGRDRRGDRRRRRRDQLLHQLRRQPGRPGPARLPGRGLGRHLRRGLGRQLRPGASTVQSTSPWVTTVGAHTLAPYYGTVTLGNGRAYAGISTTVDEPVGPARLVNGTAVVAAGQTAATPPLCAPDSLDPAKTAGTIVVCDRGVVERTSSRPRSSGPADRDGAGQPDREHARRRPAHVPTVHVDPPASTAITAYAATAGATATLTEGNETST